MNTLPAESLFLPSITRAEIIKDALRVDLSDGRTVTVPLAWYPKLSAAKTKELKHYKISPSGYGIHWPELDEDLSVLGFLQPTEVAGLRLV